MRGFSRVGATYGPLVCDLYNWAPHMTSGSMMMMVITSLPLSGDSHWVNDAALFPEIQHFLVKSSQVVTKWSPSGHQVVTKWSSSGHQVVTKWSPSGLLVVTKFSPSCHQTVIKWSPSGHQTVTKWSPSIHQEVTKCNNLLPKMLILRTFVIKML